MKPFYLSLLFLGLSMIGIPHANAFDGNRSGFVLGFGAGLGKMAADFGLLSHAGLQTDLKIGAGVSDRLLIHYSGKQLWLSADDSFFTLANPMVGVTYYLNDSDPSAFVTGGAGLALAAVTWRRTEVGGVAGLGAYAGAGYEFVPHWNVELNIIYNHFSAGTEGSLWNFTLTINVLGY